MAATDNEIEVVVFVNETPNAAPPEETITELPIEDNDDDESVVLAPPSSSTTKKKCLIAALASIALVAGVAIGVGTGAKKNTNDVSSISSSKNLVNMENLEKCLQSSEIMKRAIDDEDVTPAPSTYQPSTYTPTSTPVLMSNDVSDLTASSGNEIRRELRGARHGKHMSEKEARVSGSSQCTYESNTYIYILLLLDILSYCTFNHVIHRYRECKKTALESLMPAFRINLQVIRSFKPWRRQTTPPSLNPLKTCLKTRLKRRTARRTDCPLK